MKLYQKAAEGFIRILYPKVCPLCEKILEPKETICMSCRRKLPWIGEHMCLKCGKRVEEEEEYCYDCRQREHSFDQGIGVFAYSPEMKDSIYRFKYGNKREYARFYAEAILQKYRHKIESWEADAIIPVPLHKSREKSRGYNQAELLARPISSATGIPVYTNYLCRVKKTVPQKELNDIERQNNLKNAFKITGNDVKLKKIVLVDDIYTTGATMDNIAKVLKNSGVDEVYGISICIGQGY